MTHKHRKKVHKFHLLKSWTLSLITGSFSCSLDVLYGDLGINKLQFFYQKKISGFSQVFVAVWGGPGRGGVPGVPVKSRNGDGGDSVQEGLPLSTPDRGQVGQCEGGQTSTITNFNIRNWFRNTKYKYDNVKKYGTQYGNAFKFNIVLQFQGFRAAYIVCSWGWG
jgi:hypothetical protein